MREVEYFKWWLPPAPGTDTPYLSSWHMDVAQAERRGAIRPEPSSRIVKQQPDKTSDEMEIALLNSVPSIGGQAIAPEQVDLFAQWKAVNADAQAAETALAAAEILSVEGKTDAPTPHERFRVTRLRRHADDLFYLARAAALRRANQQAELAQGSGFKSGLRQIPTDE